MNLTDNNDENQVRQAGTEGKLKSLLSNIQPSILKGLNSDRSSPLDEYGVLGEVQAVPGMVGMRNFEEGISMPRDIYGQKSMDDDPILPYTQPRLRQSAAAESTTSYYYRQGEGIKMENEDGINYREFEIPVIRENRGLRIKPLHVRIFNFLAKRSMPYSFYDEYFREVTAKNNREQAEYMTAIGFCPRLKKYMVAIEDSNTGQLVEYRVDKEKYNSEKMRLKFS